MSKVFDDSIKCDHIKCNFIICWTQSFLTMGLILGNSKQSSPACLHQLGKGFLRVAPWKCPAAPWRASPPGCGCDLPRHECTGATQEAGNLSHSRYQ